MWRPWTPLSPSMLAQPVLNSGSQATHPGDLTLLAFREETGNETSGSQSITGNLEHHSNMAGRLNKDLLLQQHFHYQRLLCHISTCFVSQDSLCCLAFSERSFNLFPLRFYLNCYVFIVLSAGFTKTISTPMHPPSSFQLPFMLFSFLSSFPSAFR